MKPLFLVLLPVIATACIAQQAAPVAVAVNVAAPAKPLQTVETVPWRSTKWRFETVRLLSDLPGFDAAPVDTNLDKYGGLKSQVMTKTGFFHAEKAADGRWWMVDPEGNGFINRGVNAVNQSDSATSKTAFATKFGGESQWAEQTAQLLRAAGFNGTACWSDDDVLMKAPDRLPYAPRLNLMGSYKNSRPLRSQVKGRKTTYPADAILAFDPDFVTYCDEQVKQLAKGKNDPYLLGYFSDNELPLYKSAIDDYLSLEPTDPGYQAATAWLHQKHGKNATTKDITDGDRGEFLAYVADTYFSIVSKAIKKYDPNHMYFGTRFHSNVMDQPQLMAAAGQYLDVVSINYYGNWEPRQERMDNWAKSSGKPFLVTEFYTKGEDTGMKNTSGAGWTVRTQHDRGLFYEQFVIGLLENRNCVGWHWFKYMDNDPANPGDESNTDSNKGILDTNYQPYQPMLDVMKETNARVYRVANYFDKRADAGMKAKMD